MFETKRVQKHVKTDYAFCQLVPTQICSFVWSGCSNYRVKQTQVAQGSFWPSRMSHRKRCKGPKVLLFEETRQRREYAEYLAS